MAVLQEPFTEPLELMNYIDGEWVEVPVMRFKPKDVAILLDRLLVLFDRPASIPQHQGLTVSTELPADALREFIEATRGRAGPSPMDGGVTAAAKTAGRLTG